MFGDLKGKISLSFLLGTNMDRRGRSFHTRSSPWTRGFFREKIKPSPCLLPSVIGSSDRRRIYTWICLSLFKVIFY